MTGWRIGFACAPQPVIEAMMKIHQYAILCAPIMGQEAAIEALERGEQSMLEMRREYELRRNYIVRGFNELGLECFKPRGAFYVFPKISFHRADQSRIFPPAPSGKESGGGSRDVHLVRAAKGMFAAAMPPDSIKSKSPSNASASSAAN